MSRASSSRRRGKQHFLTEMNVIPYIDVMLVLLLIFMLTTPLLTQGVNVSLPKAESKVLSLDKQKPMIITVDEAGRLYLNTSFKPKEPLDPTDLAAQVASELKMAQRQNIEKPVFVKGDANTQYDKVVQAMILLQKAGVEKVGLLTDPQKTSQNNKRHPSSVFS